MTLTLPPTADPLVVLPLLNLLDVQLAEARAAIERVRQLLDASAAAGAEWTWRPVCELRAGDRVRFAGEQSWIEVRWVRPVLAGTAFEVAVGTRVETFNAEDAVRVATTPIEQETR